MNKDYLPATFAGLKFYIKRDPMGFGRRKVITELPQTPIPSVEDTGRKPRTLSLDAYLYGADVLKQVQAWIKLAETETKARDFQHPYFGIMQVVLTDATVTSIQEDYSQNIASLELSFTEGLPQQSARVIGASQADTTASKEALRQAVVLQAVGKENLQASLGQVLDSATSQISTFETNTGGFVKALQAFTSELQTIQFTVSALVTTLFSVFDALASSSADTRVNTFDSILATPRPLANGETSTATLQVWDDALKWAALIYRTEALSQVSFTSHTDALKALNEQQSQVDVMLPTISHAPLYESFQDLNAQVYEQVRTEAKRLPKVKFYKFDETMPALVVAYETLGDALRANEIMGRNRFQNWNAIPAGEAIEVVA
jgi:prophage DNA circulation protein